MHNGRIITLVIETSNPGPSNDQASVALFAGASDREYQLLRKADLSARSRHDDALMPAVDLLCRNCSIAARDLDRIAVSVGPGGFTSVRIAVTAAKFISEATGAQCIAVPTALALAGGAHRTVPDAQRITVLLAWKREDVWSQTFTVERVIAPLGEPQLVRLDELTVASSGELLVIDESLAGKLACQAHAPNPAQLITARFDPEDVFRASWLVPAVDPAHVLPLYPREPEAVTKWRQMHS